MDSTKTIIAAASAVRRPVEENWQEVVRLSVELLPFVTLLDDVTYFNSEQDTTIVAAIYATIDDEDPRSYVLRLEDDGEWTLRRELPVDEVDQPQEFWAAHVVGIPAVVISDGQDEDDQGGYWVTYWDGGYTLYEGCFFEDLDDARKAGREMAEA